VVDFHIRKETSPKVGIVEVSSPELLQIKYVVLNSRSTTAGSQ
jgi:hypothetical protein